MSMSTHLYKYMFTTFILAVLVWETKSQSTCSVDYARLQDVMRNLTSMGYETSNCSMTYKYNVTSYGANVAFVYGLYYCPKDDIINDNFTYNYIYEQSHQNYYNGQKWAAQDVHNEEFQSGGWGHASWENFFRMYGSTAFVYAFCTPPATYFSMKTYQHHRVNPLNTTSKLTIPYGSLSDMLNFHHLNTTNSANQKWDELAIIISTGDIETYNDISRLLISYGFPSDSINWDQIPLDWVFYSKEDAISQIRNNETLDTFSVMYRYGNPVNRNNATLVNWFFDYYVQWNNSLIYRIDYNNKSNIPRDPITNIPERETITPNPKEQILYLNDFTEYVDNTIYHVLNYTKLGNYKLHFRYITTHMASSFYSGNQYYGYGCITYNTACLADNKDSMYPANIYDFIQMRNDSIYLLISMEHAKTGFAEFSSIEPYFQVYSEILGVTMRAQQIAIQSFEYDGSAQQYPPNNQINNNDKMYINLFAMESTCQKLKNTELYDLPKFCITQNLLDVSNNVFIINRNYINPTSTTHADFSQLIPFVIVEFNSQWKQCSYRCDDIDN